MDARQRRRAKAVVALVRAGWTPPLKPEQAQRLLDDMEAVGRTRATLELSDLERRALVLKADGLTRDKIAARLAVSPQTVKSTERKLVRKLGARNGTHAVAIALRDGLIS